MKPSLRASSRLFVLLLSSLCLCVSVVPSFSSAARAAEPTYWGEVRAVLRKNCTVCHNARNLKEVELSGGLALDSYQAVLKWKDRALVHPGKSAQSPLYQVVVTADSEKRMPLGARPLPPESVEVLRRWIDSGAKEGVRPADTTTVVTRPPARVRKLDVLLPTSLAAGSKAPLTLALKVGPLSPIAAVAFSPDGKLLAVGSYGSVTVWDVAEVQPVKTLTNVLGAVNDLRFSPDGKLLAVAGGQPSAKGDLRLFEVGSWKLHAVLAGHDDVVNAVAFSPDGKRLATASFDKTVRVFDVASGKQSASFTHHSDFAYAVAFSPDGKALFSASKDRSVRMVEADSGKGLLTFSDREQDVLALAVSPDGKQVVASGLEPGLSWFSPETGARVRSQSGHRGAVHELAFSRDGKLLASAGADGTVRLWNGNTGAALRTLTAGPLVYSVALSPDARLVAAGSFDGLVRLYDTSSGRALATLLAFPSKEGGEASWLALASTGHAAGSDDLVALGRWSAGPRSVPAEVVWKGVRQPGIVARVVRGENVPEPVLDRK